MQQPGARMELAKKETIKALLEKHGEAHRKRIASGVCQVAKLWRNKDGAPEEFTEFCQEYFVADKVQLDKLFSRLQDNFEQIGGYFHEISRYVRNPLELDTVEDIPIDKIFSEWSPGAHLSEDFFQNKIAFVVLLNFQAHGLKERLENGANWTRRQWAEDRLASAFRDRVPASIDQKITQASTAAEHYIQNYNFCMDKVLAGGQEMFPKGLKLTSHWGLRDYLKGLYAEEGKLVVQEAIFQIMNRIVRQTVPRAVIDSSKFFWDPYHDVRPPEPDTRYLHLLEIFKAVRKSDEYYSENNYIERKFSSEREIPEARFEGLTLQVLSSPFTAYVGKYISRRLGRELRPFDLWYNQFVPQKKAEELNALVWAKYPTVAALSAAIPEILMKLGFDRGRAVDIAGKIVLEAGKSAGYALGAERREDKHYIRVCFPKGKIINEPDYMSFGVMMHELGHGVEGYFSCHAIDYFLLEGVPNIAFTEALAFVFENKALEILGVENGNAQEKYFKHLSLFWENVEMAGVGLVDMKIWRWMYSHPEATPAELKSAVIDIACRVWNDYFAPVYGIKDQPILAIYSHIIDSMLYMSDYFLGTLIQHQIQEYLKDKNLAKEAERMYLMGNLAPDLWMERAVGAPISAQPLLKSVEKALLALGEK